MYFHLDQLVSRSGVAIISREISQWLNKDKSRTLKELAKKACLSPRTVSRLHSRDTVEPRMTTILLTLKALGFVAMRLERDDTNVHEFPTRRLTA